MRIVALVESTEHVCCRYRVGAFVPGLTWAGHDVQLVPIPRGLGRLRLGRIVCDADVVVLQRKLLPDWQLTLVRRLSRCLVFDCDDAVFLRDSYHPRGTVSRRLRHRFRSTVIQADAVFAGNAWLAEQANAAGARHAMIVPTCVDTLNYGGAVHERRTAPLTLVWLGSRSTLRGLERARPLLEHLGQAVPDLKLRLVCDDFLDFTNLQVECVPWSPAAEVEALQSADVGLSLLPEDDWSRGKCGLKVLQYMAAGLPVLGNPVGVTADLLRPDTPAAAGFCPNRPTEWVAALERLRDPALRGAMGAAGRRRVEQEFSVTSGLKRWLSFLNALTVVRRAS